MALRFTTAGESHGPGLTAVVEGLPAGLTLAPEDIDRDLARRQLGHGRGGRMKIEKDRADGHLRAPPRAHARQPGVAARGQPRLRQLGGADEPVAGGGRDRGGAPAAPRPRRPGRRCRSSASRDVRNVLERASARETAARVACGALAKVYLRAFGVEVRSHVIQIGSVKAPERDELSVEDFEGVDESPVRCLDAEASSRDGGRDRRRAEGQRVARRRVRGARVRARAGRSARTCPGTAGSTDGWRRRSCRSRR